MHSHGTSRVGIMNMNEVLWKMKVIPYYIDKSAAFLFTVLMLQLENERTSFCEIG